jgi:hypothetical protein
VAYYCVVLWDRREVGRSPLAGASAGTNASAGAGANATAAAAAAAAEGEAGEEECQWENCFVAVDVPLQVRGREARSFATH